MPPNPVSIDEHAAHRPRLPLSLVPTRDRYSPRAQRPLRGGSSRAHRGRAGDHRYAVGKRKRPEDRALPHLQGADMLTFRAVQPSRLAMLSVFAVGSAMSSSSQRRPRAIDATSSARFSDRMGRDPCGEAVSGRRSWRRRVDGVLRQGASMTLRLRFDRLEPIPFALVWPPESLERRRIMREGLRG